MSKEFGTLVFKKNHPHKYNVLLSACDNKKSQTDSNWLTDTSELSLTLLRVYKSAEAQKKKYKMCTTNEDGKVNGQQQQQQQQ